MVDGLGIIGVSVDVTETQPPLVVDADAVPAGTPGHRGSIQDETGAGGPELPASPAVPSETAGDGGFHPTMAF